MDNRIKKLEERAQISGGSISRVCIELKSGGVKIDGVIYTRQEFETLKKQWEKTADEIILLHLPEKNSEE